MWEARLRLALRLAFRLPSRLSGMRRGRNRKCVSLAKAVYFGSPTFPSTSRILGVTRGAAGMSRLIRFFVIIPVTRVSLLIPRFIFFFFSPLHFHSLFAHPERGAFPANVP